MQRRIRVTEHAHQRIRERAGWEGNKRSVEAMLLACPAVRAGLMLTKGERWAVHLRRANIIAVMEGATVVTFLTKAAIVPLWRDQEVWRRERDPYEIHESKMQRERRLNRRG